MARETRERLIYMNTTEYRFLKKRKNELEKRFITTYVLNNPTSERSQDMIMAYRFFTHAEIESYIESVVLNKINKAVENWEETGSISKVLLAIAHFSDSIFPNISNKISEINGKNNLEFRITKSAIDFRNKIKNNHGVKEQNIVPLLIPIGIDPGLLDQTLLNNLSSFGTNRGDCAHNSLSVRNPKNPEDEKRIVNYIFDGLDELDNMIRLI